MTKSDIAANARDRLIFHDVPGKGGHRCRAHPLP